MSSRTFFAVGTIVALLGLSPAQASELYSVEYAGATPLYLMNQATGAASVIGATGFDNVGDLTSDTRTGSYRVWGMKIDTNELLSINPTTGAASIATSLNSPNDMVSIAFDVVSGKLYGNTSVSFGAPADALYQIDPTTGNCTFIGNLLFSDVYALGFDQTGSLFGVSDATDQLISISTATGNGALVANLRLSSIFDIASRPEDNTMFLVDSGTFHVMTLNTSNGTVADVGAYGLNSPNLVGLAFSPVPEPGTLALALIGLAGLVFVAYRKRGSSPM